jgi:hypothetical protein
VNSAASGGGGGGGDNGNQATSAVDSGGGVSPASTSDSSGVGGGKGSIKENNQLYGLHALNNLDIAVNGKDVNAMPSYQGRDSPMSNNYS